MKIKKNKLVSLLNNNLKKHIVKEDYVIEEVDAISLLTADRFDILAKYLYVKFLDEEIKSDFAKELYLEHINVFNGFIENDESQKIGKDAFLNAFDNTIQSIKRNGFDSEVIIPVGKNNVILDGAHRVAAAIYFNEKVKIVKIDMEPLSFDYKFFQNRGLSEFYLDSMAMEYAKLKNNIYTVLLWPSSGGKEEEKLQKILHEYGDIIYRKNIYLKNEGPVHLVKQAYKTEKWLGDSKNDFIGARNKAKWCFQQKAPVRVVLFESNKNMVEMKDEIRALYKIEKHAVHINDTKEELLELSGLLFNSNSIHWLNNSLMRNFSWFDRLLEHYKVWLNNIERKNDSFCIDGSATLAIYGIREVRDLDFIHDKDIEMNTEYKEIGDHNNELKYHSVIKDEIIFNPKNYMIIDSLKFISLKNIQQMKQNRNEVKDQKDIIMINNIISNKLYVVPLNEKIRLWIELSYWKARIKFTLLKIRYFLTKLKKGI